MKDMGRSENESCFSGKVRGRLETLETQGGLQDDSGVETLRPFIRRSSPDAGGVVLKFLLPIKTSFRGVQLNLIPGRKMLGKKGKKGISKGMRFYRTFWNRVRFKNYLKSSRGSEIF